MSKQASKQAKSDWVEVNPGRVGIDEDNPVFEGTYMGSYIIRRENDAGEMTDGLVHRFDCDGRQTDLWGSAAIDKRLPSYADGTEMRLEYRGKSSGKGGRQFKAISIYVRPDAKTVSKANVKGRLDEQVELPF